MLRRLACPVLIVLAFAACSEPPIKERQAAERAIEAARTAGAATYAPEDLQAAEGSLKKYGDAVAQRDYRQALNDALEARDRADAASKQATIKRAQVRTQAEMLMKQLETLSKVASSRLSGSTGRPVGPAAERLRRALRGATPALQEARSRLGAEDYQGAVDALAPAVEVLRRELPPPEPAPPKRKK
jgi:hypothetical protein